MEKLEQFFKRKFSTVSEALVARKEHLHVSPTKMNLNWKEIGRQFHINAKQAHIRFDAMESKYLEKWTTKELDEMRTEIRNLYQQHPNQKEIKRLLDQKFHFLQVFHKQMKQVDNLINHEFARLDAQ